MTLSDQFEKLEKHLHEISMMGQWYQRYDVSTSAMECKKLVKELKKELDPPCGMSHK